MSDPEDEPIEGAFQDETYVTGKTPPFLPEILSHDERYFTLLAMALRKCKDYLPRFGQGMNAGITVEKFEELYGADPFYN